MKKIFVAIFIIFCLPFNYVNAYEDSVSDATNIEQLYALPPKQNRVRGQFRQFLGYKAYVVNNINGYHYGGYVPFSHQELSTGLYIYEGIAPLIGMVPYNLDILNNK